MLGCGDARAQPELGRAVSVPRSLGRRPRPRAASLGRHHVCISPRIFDPRRWPRETRLLVVTIVLSLAVLLILARFRFPDAATARAARAAAPAVRRARGVRRSRRVGDARRRARAAVAGRGRPGASRGDRAQLLARRRAPPGRGRAGRRVRAGAALPARPRGGRVGRPAARIAGRRCAAPRGAAPRRCQGAHRRPRAAFGRRAGARSKRLPTSAPQYLLVSRGRGRRRGHAPVCSAGRPAKSPAHTGTRRCSRSASRCRPPPARWCSHSTDRSSAPSCAREAAAPSCRRRRCSPQPRGPPTRPHASRDDRHSPAGARCDAGGGDRRRLRRRGQRGRSGGPCGWRAAAR